MIQAFQANSLMMEARAIRTLIVDDEPIARRILRDELTSVVDVDIVGEAENGSHALRQIAELRPDLVFLDLQMPGLGGFEVIHRLPEDALPIIIIVTAYDQHAIRAFEAGALDYLLKPVSQERLEKAVDRARALRGRAREVAESLMQLNEAAQLTEVARLREAHDTPSPPRSRKIVGRAGEEYYLVNLEDVLAFQAEREIVWVVTASRRYTATETLRNIETRLQGSVFQRVHRNALVNVNHVRKMTPLTSQRWLLTLGNGQEFIVSKRQAHTVRQMLQW
jgi:two-component system LytT family response regulator